MKREGFENCRVISEVASKWKDLGYRLCPDYVVDQLMEEFPGGRGSMEAACEHLFERWLKGEGKVPRTWQELVQALADIRLGELSKRLKEILD